MNNSVNNTTKENEPFFSNLDRALCDLACGILSKPSRRIVEDMILDDPELAKRFQRIKELRADYSDAAFDQPGEESEPLFGALWKDAAGSLRHHAERVRQWWVECESTLAPRLPLAVLCSSDGGNTLACDYWEALEKVNLSLHLPEAAPVESVFLPESRIVFSWRPLPGDISDDANVLVLLNSDGDVVFRDKQEGESICVEGEERRKVVLDAADILEIYASESSDNPIVEVTWNYGALDARIGILRAPAVADSTPCTREECEAMAEVALAWFWPRGERDADGGEDIACFAAALSLVKGERERALIRDFLCLRDYVWSSVPEKTLKSHYVFSYLATAATLRSGEFTRPGPAPR